MSELLLALVPSGAAGSPNTSGSPSPSPAPSDNVSALPSWLLVCLLLLVVAIIAGMFGLTFYNLSAPRSTLKNILGIKVLKRGQRTGNATDPVQRLLSVRQPGPQAGVVSDKLFDTLTKSARVNKRTTRTTLAITGFAVLSVIVIALFGLSGSGVRDLRSQVVAAVTTLVAAIAGFYFGSQSSAGSDSSTGGAAQATKKTGAPQLGPDLDDAKATFTVGTAGTYTPSVIADPVPTITITHGELPAGLAIDRHTGVISGTPEAASVGAHPITLTASNNVEPDAKLSIVLTVQEPAAT